MDIIKYLPNFTPTSYENNEHRLKIAMMKMLIFCEYLDKKKICKSLNSIYFEQTFVTLHSYFSSN